MGKTEQPVNVKALIEGSGIEVDVWPGDTLRDALELTGIHANTECNGLGICGQCRVRFKSNAPTPNFEESYMLSERELAQGWRLACQTVPENDCCISLPKTGACSDIRVLTEVSAQESLLPEMDDRRFHEGIGVAVDVGTTTIACYLIDLAQGRQIDVASFANPQRCFGADVISRIQYARQGADSLKQLQQVLIEKIEQHMEDLCICNKVESQQVRQMTAVGNSTMMHILWGVDPWPLGVAPYEPAFTKSLPRSAHELGFKRFSEMKVELLPGIAGHLGADTVGGVLTLDFEQMEGPCLFLDLGTNGEIALFNEGKALGCTCAAGPAFEGVHISSGTPAIRGAIDRVQVEAGRLTYSTIDDASPVGLCGSGLVDTVSVLLKESIIESSGRFKKAEQLASTDQAEWAQRIRSNGNSRMFVIDNKADGEPIALTQADVRQVQLAKSAFRTGIDFLLDEMGIDAQDIRHVYVGGGFGSHLRMQSLITLGVLPDCMEGIVEAAGNVAGYGAKLALVNHSRHGKALEIGRWIKNIVLESQSGFTHRFTENLGFPAVKE